MCCLQLLQYYNRIVELQQKPYNLWGLKYLSLDLLQKVSQLLLQAAREITVIIQEREDCDSGQSGTLGCYKVVLQTYSEDCTNRTF